MSLRLRSELWLRLGPRHCEARLLKPGWRGREGVALRVETSQGSPLSRALDELQARGLRLPSRARIVAEDEFLFFANLPGAGRLSQVRAAAQRHFDSTLGAGDWLTQVSLNAPGDAWLAVALPADLKADWASMLAERDIELVGIGAAAFEDLHRARAFIPAGLGVMVLVRDEGLVFAEIQEAGVTRLHWQRCQTDQASVLAERIQAALLRLAAQVGDGVSRILMTVQVAPLGPWQQATCEALVDGRGWKLLPPMSDAPLAPRAETDDASPATD